MYSYYQSSAKPTIKYYTSSNTNGDTINYIYDYSYNTTTNTISVNGQDILYNNPYDDMISYNTNIRASFIKDILGLSNIHKTYIPQKVEEKLYDYVQELDKYFLEDMGSSIDSYLHDKAYDIAEKVMEEALEEDYCLSTTASSDDLIYEIVSSIDFDECYEIINDILGAPQTFEEHLRDLGMSIHDFI